MSYSGAYSSREYRKEGIIRQKIIADEIGNRVELPVIDNFIEEKQKYRSIEKFE